MKLSQTLRMTILYVVFAVVSFLIVAFFAAGGYTRVTLKSEADRLYRTALVFVENYAGEYYSGNMDKSLLRRQMMSVAAYLNSTVWIVDREGNIAIATDDSSEDPEKQVDFDPSEFNRNNYLTDRYNESFNNKRMLTVCAPITVGYEIRGYVLIHEPYDMVVTYSDEFLNVTYVTVILTGTAALLLLLIYWFFTERVALEIVKTAASYREKDFDAALPKAYDREYEYIIASLSYMATELATLETDQQKFISNISHDLRSPLTSIKGYIEAILDGVIPPEQEEKYLRIVLSEVERLSVITSGLLELNSYGGHGKMILDRGPFDIAEAIRETARSFEGRLQEKHIVLQLYLSDREMMVFADKGKIDRVLHNLLDNSIKFSDNNSAIRIEAKEQKNKVQISVKDNGIGIPSDQIGKIWDRFYKTDISRGKDKMGTGIGLSIVKDIINAHGENISVISTEGVGCEFIFSLPVYDEEWS